MLTSAVFLVCLLSKPTPSTPRPPAQKVYVDTLTGFRFTHPASWRIDSKRLITVVHMPVLTDKNGAEVQIMDTGFTEEPAKWQGYQATAANSAGRKVDQQWTEELLNVPLLLTKVSFSDKKGQPYTRLTGLLYSKNDRKFLFHLVAASALYDTAEKQWREALVSMRTVNGDVPQPETPGRLSQGDTPTGKKNKQAKQRPVQVLDPKYDPIKPKTRIVIPADPQKPLDKIVRGSVSIDCKPGGRDATLSVPAGWELTGKDLSYAAKRDSVDGVITIETQNVLDSPAPEDALLKASGKNLGDFDKVTHRHESAPHISRSGVKLWKLTREGLVRGKPTSELYAVGQFGDFYWLMSYRTANAASIKLVEELADRTVLVPRR